MPLPFTLTVFPFTSFFFSFSGRFIGDDGGDSGGRTKSGDGDMDLMNKKKKRNGKHFVNY